MAAKKQNTEITYDKRNYRKHSDKNKRIIKKSVDEYGAGRSILLDSENEIIAGNGVKEQWGDRPIRIIETDGSELIAVKRTDLKTADEKRKQLALIDNHSSDTSEWDKNLIKNDFSTEALDDWGIVLKEGFFEKDQKNKQGEFLEAKVPYPITIVITKDDYDKWNEIKKQVKEDSDLKAFIKVLKTITP